MLYDQAQLSVVYSQAFQVTFAPNLNPGCQSQGLPGNGGFLLISTPNSFSHLGYPGFPPPPSTPWLTWENVLHESQLPQRPLFTASIPHRSLVMNSTRMLPKASCSM